MSLPSATPSTSTSSTSSTSSASSTPTSSSGLSVGAIVGLSVGVAAGALILAGVAGLFVWRHYRSKNDAKVAAATQEKGPEGGASGQSKGKGKEPQAVVSPIWQGPGARELETPHVYHELHSNYLPAEAHGEALRGELDATPPRAELHSQDLPPRYSWENDPSPGAYGNFKGPI